MSQTVELSLPQKIIGNMLVLAVLGGIIYLIIFGMNWLVEMDRARYRSLKEDCVIRGGSVTEHVGGLTQFDCVAPKSFR